MNYRHVFHAGGFADVFKHALLSLLLGALRAKDKSFCYLETHAGAGRYDLRSAAARRGAEFESGIARVWCEPAPPPELAGYLAAVRAANVGGRPGTPPRYYPGSPGIAAFLLRPQDRLALWEFDGAQAGALRREFAHDPRVRVHHQDGYLGLPPALPPRERRGLVLIDPPYEAPDEFDSVLGCLESAQRRWPSGLYAIWYPIKERIPVERFHRRLRASGIKKILCAELLRHPPDVASRLNGCGMILINPPWRLDETLGRLLPHLLAMLRADTPGSAGVSWLVAA